MTEAQNFAAVLPSRAKRQFSSNNLSQNDARVIELSSPMRKTHMKANALCCFCYCGPTGWGDYCFWAFDSCGEVSSSTHPII